MTIYLAGPMTGIPHHNVPAFDAAEEQLLALGYTVVSPARMLRKNPDDTLRQHFSRDCQAICESDLIVLLEGWERSPGVAVELALAKYLGIPYGTLAEVLLAEKEPPLISRKSYVSPNIRRSP